MGKGKGNRKGKRKEGLGEYKELAHNKVLLAYMSVHYNCCT